jgi:hypothetical protein
MSDNGSDDFRTPAGIARNIEVIKHTLIGIAILLLVLLWKVVTL